MKAIIKRKQFTQKEKIKTLRQVNKGRKQTEVAQMFNVKPMILSTILKDWEKIVKLYEHSAICPGRKRLQLGDYSKVEETVNTWFKEARSTGVSVCASIQAKAKKFGCLMKKDDSEASSGWLFRF